MTYTLGRLAPGSFDLLLDRKVVGSVVRNVSKDGHEGDWTVEALVDRPPFPVPFTREARKFRTLSAAVEWLDTYVPEL